VAHNGLSTRRSACGSHLAPLIEASGVPSETAASDFSAPLAPTYRLTRLRDTVADHRERVRHRLQQGATGIQVAATQTQLTEEFLVTIWTEHLASFPLEVRMELAESSAVIAVGGTGRGDMAPYSDVDLLFLQSNRHQAVFEELVARTVRDSWDAGLKLGHSVRSTREALRTAMSDPQFATTLVDARCIWGSAAATRHLLHRFRKDVVQRRQAQFIQASIDARVKERDEFGATVQQLEPDVKRSLGGLRDLHLIRWIGFAHYGTSDPSLLKLEGALSAEDARRLLFAHEFLTSIRINLHLHAGRSEDVLTRDAQLRITAERHVAATAGQRAVERFMQQYFEHTMAVAEIAGRFVARHVPKTITQQLSRLLTSVKIDGIYRLANGEIDVARRHRDSVGRSLESILQLYLTATLQRATVAPRLKDELKTAARALPDDISPEAARCFLEILSRPGQLGPTLRNLYDIGVLERLVPAFRHIRCLLQFNQYHHYTVDEHTLRAVEAAERLEADRGTIGQAFRELQQKEILFLALLLHDAGKGYEEDHSDVGARLAVETAQRLGLTEDQKDLLVFLVHRHLLMATLAFRRDISDPEILLRFNHDVGSPDVLRALFVLTVADISAVGPGVWNDWKAELLTTLYDQSMVWLSGKSYLFELPMRTQRVLAEVHRALSPSGQATTADQSLVKMRLDSFPAHYWLATTPLRIAADVRLIASRQPDEIHIESVYEPETRTVDYRVITSESVCTGCFHKITGVLSAKRLEILSAQISTTTDGVIVDSYRTRDYDHDGDVPDFRREEIATAIHRVLRGELDVETMFANRARFAPNRTVGPVSNLPRKVLIDQQSSDRFTIVDIFAHDRPGLLYRIARTFFEQQVSVSLAKISTHFDQIVDVFYVSDRQGAKITDPVKLKELRHALTAAIDALEQSEVAH
jgi:[protein-PII] uridylyltransferase